MSQPTLPPRGEAQDSPSDPDASLTSHYLTFFLANEVFATDIRTVREIIQYGAMTTVPLMPRFVRGVINLRGSVVPVIDLRCRFGRPAGVVGEKTCIVIIDAVRDGERLELGLMVDGVSEVIEIQQRQIESPPDFGTSLRHDFMRGIVKLGGRFVVVLAPERAFDVEEMAQLCATARLPLAA